MKRAKSVKRMLVPGLAALLLLAWGAGDALAGGRYSYSYRVRPAPRHLHRPPGGVVYFGYPIYSYRYRPAPRPYWRKPGYWHYHRPSDRWEHRGTWPGRSGWHRR